MFTSHNTTTTKNQKINVTSILAFTFSILYIFAELTFNIGLIDFLNSKNTEIDRFHQLETFGRILSSIGIGLFLSKILSFFNKSKVLTYLSFIFFAIFTYSSQTFIFNKILENLSPEQKFNAYAIGVYRNLNLNNQISLKILNSENIHYDASVNSMLGLFTTLPKEQDDITKQVTKFFQAENTIDQDSLGKIYDEFQTNVPNTDEYWKLYAIESRRFETYNGLFKKKYRENFISSIGMEPSLSKEQFEAQIESKMGNINNQVKNIVIIPANIPLKISELKVGDIPPNLNKQDWVNFINTHINSALEKNSFISTNVNVLPYSENIIASVVITPIAVILSLIALFMNIVLLIARWTKIGAVITLSFILFISGSWNYNPYGFNPILNKFVGLETQLIQSMSIYRNILHSIFINDNNPDTFKVIRLEKPKMPDMSAMKETMDKQFQSLKEANNSGENATDSQMENFERVSKEINVDDERFKDSHYYGELKKANPYLNQ